MTTPQITSTAQLIPDGLKGYSKAVAAFVSLLGTVLATIEPSLPAGSQWARWVGLAVAICGAVGVYLVPNAVKPTPPAPVLDEPNIPGP